MVYPALLSPMLMALTLTSYHHYSSHERASIVRVSREEEIETQQCMQWQWARVMKTLYSVLTVEIL